MTFCINCADLTIRINCEYESTKEKCKKYIVESENADITLSPDELYIATAKKHMPEENLEEIEFSALLCALNEKLPQYNACILHACVVSFENNGYAFAGKSGVGKTTHARLWQKVFGDGCVIVNGDKPILTFKDNKVLASGTPWCGKEDFSENLSVPLKGICFINRADIPSVRKLTSSEVIDKLFYQLSIPTDGKNNKISALQTAHLLICRVPFYELNCNISEKSVYLAYEEMSKH